MRFCKITGKPISRAVIDTLARLDVQLSLMDEEATEDLWDWVLHGGADVSLTARSLLIASIYPSNSTSAPKERDTTQS